MNKVVNLNDRRKGVMAHINNIYELGTISKREVMSMIVLNMSTAKFQSPKAAFGVSSNELLKGISLNFDQSMKKQAAQGMLLVPTDTPKDQFLAYEFKQSIDIDLAIELNLGVIYHEGKQLVYYVKRNNSVESAFVEMLLLKVYVQLMYPDKVDLKFKEGFNEKVITLLKNSILLNADTHIQNLSEIFKK